LQLVQLIGENDWRESGADYERMRTREGLDEIASYAAGIGPRVEHVLVKGNGRSEGIAASSLVAWAHGSGLVVHPYTHRIDALPQGVASSRQALELLFKTARVDGLFTDFPDVVAEYLKGEFGRSK
jgi:glycerophosphoryl diester phosphodiesterase